MNSIAGQGRQQGRGDYHGWPTHRLENEHVWLEVLATAGPRIVRLGLSGSADNVLAETPEVGWQTALGRYELFGGHRLWFAPEDPDHGAVPDSDGLILSVIENGVELDGPAEPATGMTRSISVRLDPTSSAVELSHRVSNMGEQTLELAPWSITQLPAGGLVCLPQPAAVGEHIVRPNRLIVLWPYSSWEDPRLELRDGRFLVHADPGPHLKVGTFIAAGMVSYSRGPIRLTCRFEPIAGRVHPDMGCNVEVYLGERFVEVEILGPLVDLAPGSTITLDERWELARDVEAAAA